MGVGGGRGVDGVGGGAFARWATRVTCLCSSAASASLAKERPATG